MLLNLTNLSAETMHSQISRQLLEKILCGDLSAGYELPTIRALASRQRVGLNTVRRAYEALESDGIIKHESGNRFTVATLSAEQKQTIAKQRLLSSQSPLNVVHIFSKQLFSVFDVEELRNIFKETLQSHLSVKSVYFARRDEETDRYVLLASAAEPGQYRIDRQDSFLQAISRLKIPMPVNEIRTDNLSSALFEKLLELKTRLVFPFRKEGRLLGFMALSGKSSGVKYSIEDINLLMVLAGQFVTALTTARYYVEAMEKRRMEEELNMARQIQADLLPKELPGDEYIDLAAYSRPSRTVGGDFYDYIPIDEHRLGLVIADACGKGLPAAMIISQIQAMMKSEINNGNDVPTVLKHVNKQVVRFTPKDKFVTLFYGVFDRESQQFEYATAGHNYPVLIRKDGSNENLSVGGPGLGIFSEANFETETVRLQEGDLVFFYTDGVTETMNLKNEEYGEQRLLDMLVRHRHLSARGIIDTMLDDLDNFHSIGPLQDDRTVLVLKSNNN